MEFHEYANIFPMLGEGELEELRADIEKNGLAEPIVTLDGKVLDGRNRATACMMLGIKPKSIEYTGDDPIAYVVSKNLKRRHLNESQRAMVAERIAVLPKGNPNHSNTEISVFTQAEASKALNVSVDSIQHARKVRAEGTPKLAEAVEQGKIAVSTAAKLTKETAEKQAEIIEKVNEGKTVTDAIREVKREEIVAKLEDTATKKAKAIQGVYDVIVIDPPWSMQKIERDVAPEQVEFDYPTMSEEELRELHIPAADDCHLWIWTTHKFLPVALRLLEVWGFKYVCNFVWHKSGGFQPFGLPQYNCEFAIYARKGTPQFIDTKAFFTCFDAPRGAHSEKPEEFYDVVRRVTAGRRIDMFNRRKIKDFDTWGQEAQ